MPSKWKAVERTNKANRDHKRQPNAKAATIGRRQERSRKAWEQGA